MDSKVDIWVPIYIGDYLSDTMHLTTEEHGAYFLLILAYWRNQAPLPSDDKKMAAICRWSIPVWLEHKKTLSEFFESDGLFWVHKRIDSELKSALDFRAKQSANGKKGGRPPKINPKETQTKPKRNPGESPLPSPLQTSLSHNKYIISPDLVIPSEILDRVCDVTLVTDKFAFYASTGFIGHFLGREFSGDELLSELIRWTAREWSFKK